MEERSSHLTIVVGASTIAEELRRSLVRHGVAHAGVATHLRGLRKSMLLGEESLVVVCIALDQATLLRHGEALRLLLADHHCFQRNVRSVGLLAGIGLTSDIAEMGCDVYVDDSKHAVKAVRLLARHWQAQQSASASPELQRPEPIKVEADSRDSWVWGATQMPSELVPLVAPQPSDQTAASKASSSDSG